MTPASLTPRVLTSLLILLTCAAAVCSDEGQNTTCVSKYHLFEEAAITNNSENIDALFSNLYRPNHPLPYSLTVLYQVRLPNGTTQRISSDPTCPSELWMWTYSPVFLLAEPSVFNRFTLYTINYFRTWKASTVTLTVPLPCKGSTFGFLSTMTMRVNDYARGKTLVDRKHLGYVQRGCGSTVEETNMNPIFDSEEKTFEIIQYVNLLVGGVLFQAILVCLGTALLLQRWLPAITSQSLQCSKMHSMLWAVVTTAIIFWTIIAGVNTFNSMTVYKQGRYLMTAAIVVLAYIPAFLELPVAVHFARKYRFAIPCVYLAPVKMLCCGSRSGASLLVRVMSLWVTLSVVQLACVHGTFIVLAVAAAPFTVISNALVLLFTAFCLVHLFAVIFILPHLQRRESNINKSSRVKFGITILQAIAFLFFFVTLVCYVVAGAGFSYIINIQSDQGATLNFSKAILPVALGVTGFGLRMLSNMWWSNNATASTESLITVDEYQPV